jgi:Domain of unknown function (DUF222)
MGYAAVAFREVAAAPYHAVLRPAGPAAPHAAAAPDPDVIEEMGAEIATLAAHIHAATHRLLVLIAEFDRLRGWESSGHANCARWLESRTGIDLGAAREKVRTARALHELPLTSAAMARGALSFSKVRCITRVAVASNEAELLELAQGTTTAQLERLVRAWKKGSRQDEAEWERERHRARTFSVFPDDDGMYVVRGRLTPEVGAVLLRAVEAASDALYRETTVPGSTDDPELESAQRRADAVGLLAERALAAGFGAMQCGCGTDAPTTAEGKAVTPPDAADAPAPDAECGSGSVCNAGCAAPAAPISGTRAERYQVVLHVESATLAADGEPGRSELEDGSRLSAETARRLSCDASVVRVTHDENGSILDVGRKARTVSPALRRALEVRDRGCRFPGCGLRFTDAHHMVHWADGGATKMGNVCLVCRAHHRLVHEGGWRVEWWGTGRPVFIDPRGGEHFDGSWQPPELSERPVAALLRDNRRRGVEPDAWTASARWEREADIPDGVYFRASEAL